MADATFTNVTIRRDTAGAIEDVLTLDSVAGSAGNGAALSFIDNSATADLYMALGRISARRVDASAVRLDFGVTRDATTSTGDDVAPLLSLISDTDGLRVTTSVVTAVGSTLAVGGALKVGGTASLKSVTVTGRAALGTLYTSGSATLSTTLKVVGAASLGSLSVSGAASLGSLSVGGAASLSGTLRVTGATALGDSLSVGGAASLGGLLRVAGATALGDSLNVGGATSLSSVQVGGNAIFSGKIGVGRTDPRSALDVAGSIRINPLIDGQAQSAINFESRFGDNALVLNRYDVGYAYQDFATDHNVFPRIVFGSYSEHLFIGTTTPHELIFSTNNHPRMVVGADGNVGVGTVDPHSALHVAGTISINPAVGDFAQNGIHFDSGFGNTALFLHRYGEGYLYQDLAIDHNLFPRIAFGVEQEHLFIGTRTSHELVLSTNDHPRMIIGAAGKTIILKSQDDAELEVQGTVRAATFEGNGVIPRGVVVLWSGQLNTLPSDWAICDGNNGTPDLCDRFIVGAGRGYGVGATGGEVLHQLTVDELPSHNHDNGIWHLLVNNAGNGTSQRTDFTPGEVNLIDARSIQPVGGNRPHENRPPYYALAFIMKL